MYNVYKICLAWINLFWNAFIVRCFHCAVLASLLLLCCCSAAALLRVPLSLLLTVSSAAYAQLRASQSVWLPLMTYSYCWETLVGLNCIPLGWVKVATKNVFPSHENENENETVSVCINRCLSVSQSLSLGSQLFAEIYFHIVVDAICS